MPKQTELLSRVIIDKVSPSVDFGKFPVKFTLSEPVKVRAVLLCDGHESLKGDLLWRNSREKSWCRTPLVDSGNDIWTASFSPEKLGSYFFTIEASLDKFSKWKREALIKCGADTLTPLDLDQGISMFASWENSVGTSGVRLLKEAEKTLVALKKAFDPPAFKALVSDEKLAELARSMIDSSLVRHPTEFAVVVEPDYARFGSWYEFFPRSFPEPGTLHGTFNTAAAHLKYVADLGFDIAYLPPIHPIGKTNRKGKDNSLIALPEDVGCPWAVGTQDGGHKAVHPALGTMADFERFVAEAESFGIRIALDIAFQCSPDHPYLAEHEEWFTKRADGSIQFAENPPKKYEDIYPFNFESKSFAALAEELKSVFLFWIGKGVKIFRVDNPHTKPLDFWRMVIADVRARHPDVVMLSEAFTRPHIMRYLAKAGFSQSYTYFSWRVNKNEIAAYVNELRDPELSCYMRPNFWPNTPDILSGPLRNGTKADFEIRFILAATLSPCYGIYGPAYELCENTPRDQVSEEYAASEKYELKRWDITSPKSIAPLIKKVNSIRRENRALQFFEAVEFHETENESMIAYSYQVGSDDQALLCVVNLDAKQTQIGRLEFDLSKLGWQETEQVGVTDLLSGRTFQWNGKYHYIELNPSSSCAHMFRVPVRTKTRNFLSSAGHNE